MFKIKEDMKSILLLLIIPTIVAIIVGIFLPYISIKKHHANVERDTKYIAEISDIVFHAKIELVRAYLEPTNESNTYRLFRSFKMPDGRLWEVPPLTLKVGKELTVQDSSEFPKKDVKLLEIRLQLMSVNGQNGVVKSTYVYEKNGQIKTEEREDIISIKRQE